MTPDHLFREVEQAGPVLCRSVLAGLRPRKEVEAEVLEVGGGASSAGSPGRDDLPPMAGTLCLLKDNFDLDGFPTQASSLFLERVRPAPHPEGGLVKKLRECGAIPVGKTQMNEFAYGLDGANPHVGDCPNPLDPARCSGGSSSGSAYAVSKGWVPLAFGTDTGGSIRVPAAFCGIYGFRLPPDAWALDGVFPLAPSYDSVGWFTSSWHTMSETSRALLDLPMTDSAPLRVHSFIPEKGRLGDAVKELFPQSEFLPMPEAWGSDSQRVTHYNVLQSSEAYEIHKDWIDVYSDQYSPAVRSLILRAREWSQDQKEAAKAFEHSFQSSCRELFNQTDVILMPVSDAPSPIRPMTKEQRAGLLATTTPGSLGRLPVLTIPIPDGDLSLGIQCLMPAEDWKPVLSKLLQEEFINPFRPDASRHEDLL